MVPSEPQRLSTPGWLLANGASLMVHRGSSLSPVGTRKLLSLNKMSPIEARASSAVALAELRPPSQQTRTIVRGALSSPVKGVT